MMTTRKLFVFVFALLGLFGGRAAFAQMKGTVSGSATIRVAPPSGGGGGGSPAVGWTSVAGTNYAPLCPNAGGTRSDLQANSGCSGVVDAWSGGFRDTKRNRLCFWGGGHHDYNGNEVYCFDPVAGTISRIDQASSASGIADPNTSDTETMPDGTAGARHTYGGITYDEGADVMMIEGGGIIGPGDLSNKTWTLSLSGLSSGSTATCCWTNKNPAVSGGSLNFQFGNLLAYDRNTDTSWLWESYQSSDGHLWQYSRATNTYTQKADYGGGAFMDGYQSGTIDPARQIFWAIGHGKILHVSIASGSSFTVTDDYSTSTGCSTPAGYSYPGLDFDDSDQKLIIWNGAGVYSYNPSTKTCTLESYSGGPAAAAQNGTFGRLQYFPTLGYHAVCNNLNANCYDLRRSVDVAMTNSWPNITAGIGTPGGSPSIVSSQSFDTYPATNAQQYFQVYMQPQITTDCANAADGCALKFTMLDGDFQGQPGWFNYNFKSDLSAVYGQGDEFYVQFRERVSPSMLSGATFSNFEGWKLSILSEGDKTGQQANNCSNTPTDVVMLSDGTTFPWLYVNCGNDGTLKFLDSAYEPVQLYGAALPGGGNYLDQDASGCPHYGGRGTSSADPTCWNFVGDEWFTIQEHIKIGTWNTANSVLEVWAAHAGQPSVLIVNAADAALNDDGGSVTDKFGKIVLLPYATNATWHGTSYVLYDDLVVSNRRIPDPNVNVPNAPDSLSLSAISSAHVTVNWRVNSNNVTPQDDTGFLVERCTGDVPGCYANPQSGFSQIGSTAPHAATYTDSTVSSGHTYTYRVRAKNQYGNSSYAKSICFNTALPSSGSSACGSAAL